MRERTVAARLDAGKPPSGEAVMSASDGILELSPPDVHPDGTDLRCYKRLAAAVIRQALLDM